jgi:small conductance mechanosensitive channel
MDFESLWESLREELVGWAHGFVKMMPNLVAALVVAVVLYFAAKLLRKGVDKALRSTRMHQSARELIVSVVYFASLVATLMIALSILELSGAVTSILAGAGVVGLALGFAFQDLASNFISGVGLSVKHPFRIGDIIETNEVIGVVEQLQLRTTEIRTFDGKKVIVPNSKIYQEVLTNHTDNDLKRMDLSCGVAYGDDLRKVREIALEALEGVSSRAQARDPELYFTGFGDSSIDFTARIWFDYRSQKDLLHCQSEAIIAIKEAFDENGITIPFPIRTLDFGVVGGTPLDDIWPAGLRGADGSPARA